MHGWVFCLSFLFCCFLCVYFCNPFIIIVIVILFFVVCMFVYLVPKEAQKGVRFPGGGVPDSSELPYGYWE